MRISTPLLLLTSACTVLAYPSNFNLYEWEANHVQKPNNLDPVGPRPIPPPKYTLKNRKTWEKGKPSINGRGITPTNELIRRRPTLSPAVPQENQAPWPTLLAELRNRFLEEKSNSNRMEAQSTGEVQPNVPAMERPNPVRPNLVRPNLDPQYVTGAVGARPTSPPSRPLPTSPLGELQRQEATRRQRSGRLCGMGGAAGRKLGKCLGWSGGAVNE